MAQPTEQITMQQPGQTVVYANAPAKEEGMSSCCKVCIGMSVCCGIIVAVVLILVFTVFNEVDNALSLGSNWSSSSSNDWSSGLDSLSSGFNDFASGTSNWASSLDSDLGNLNSAFNDFGSSTAGALDNWASSSSFGGW